MPAVVMQFLKQYVDEVVVKHVEKIEPGTPLFFSSWGRRGPGRTRAPMIGKNIWHLSKVHGRIIGCPELKPHDLRHGVAMEVLEQHHDLEQVRALLYEEQATRVLDETRTQISVANGRSAAR